MEVRKSFCFKVNNRKSPSVIERQKKVLFDYIHKRRLFHRAIHCEAYSIFGYNGVDFSNDQKTLQIVFKYDPIKNYHMIKEKEEGFLKKRWRSLNKIRHNIYYADDWEEHLISIDLLKECREALKHCLPYIVNK